MSYSEEIVNQLIQAIQVQAETTAQLVDAVIRLTEMGGPEEMDVRSLSDEDGPPTQYLSGKPIQ